MIRYPIPEDVVLYIERLHFIKTGLNSLLLQFTYASEFPLDADRYGQLLEEYLQAFLELDLALDKTFRAYVAPEFLDGAYYTQEVDFNTKEILVQKKGAAHACSCRTAHP